MALTSNNIGQQRRPYIAISPSGEEIVTLDCDTHILKTWHIKDNEIIARIECKLRADIGIQTKGKNWSLAISDAVNGEVLIALSCFNYKKENINKNIDEQSLEDSK